jgi:hypothetical protein
LADEEIMETIHSQPSKWHLNIQIKNGKSKHGFSANIPIRETEAAK